jgi:hypothetical protein
MKRRSRLFSIAVLACALLQAGYAAPQVQTGGQRPAAQEGTKMNAESKTATEQPFFCNLSAMDADQRKHHRELTERLRQSVKEVRELADGYGFRFPAETADITLVAEWVALERLCCPFFTFQLEVGSDDKPLWLRITGREGVKPFMQSEFGIK